MKATAGVGFKLDAFGQLSLSATVLSILKGSESKEAEEDPGFLTIDLVETDVLPIVENPRGGGEISASTELQLLKVSELAVTSKKVKGDAGGVGTGLVAGLKCNLGKVGGGKNRSRDDRAHAGTEDAPVPMTWLKPLDFYVRALHRPRPDRPGPPDHSCVSSHLVPAG